MSDHSDITDTPRRDAAVRHWQTAFGLARGGDEGLESASGPDARRAQDRIAEAREAMIRLVKDRFGGDEALLRQVKSLTLSADEAIEVLRQDRERCVPTNEQMESLEAIVAFDGSRPSFLLRQHEVDFASSFNAGTWERDLQPFLSQIAQHAVCVGRVDVYGQHAGTAFLVTPTLAITNRHVAQAFARFEDGKATMMASATLDFGNEDAGLESFDRRTISEVVFAGVDEISAPIDHERLDLAVVRLSASTLTDALGQRHMIIGGVPAADLIDDRRFLATIGYPSDPELFVPETIWSEYGDVIRRLLEGDGGKKRFAPGQPVDAVRGDLTDWTATHDATTINGNSGSPLLKFPAVDARDLPRAAGLHYAGRFGGERVNWAHLLHYVPGKTGYGGEFTFGEFCAREGIQIS